jgi:hypothetical protein
MPKDLSHRNNEITMEVLAGKSCRRVGELYNLSATTVRNIAVKTSRKFCIVSSGLKEARYIGGVIMSRIAQDLKNV